ncbi:DUF6913 domain-containing protein [Flavobacterium alkalisoli]|uniref:DUF6913 domain-containing protein n=1 Tax=Flavobacterium alkalisoli TaxID=2602769 RepID=UPI003A931B4C
MFLKFIKGVGLKKNIKKCLAQYEPGGMPTKVVTIGLLMDEAWFTDKKRVINEITKHGIKEESISLLVCKKKVSAKEATQLDYPVYTRKDVSAGGKLKKEEVITFVQTPFDMLISYYDTEKPLLMLATLESQAKFKVGFANVDKRLNHFTIAEGADRYKEYMAELFRYLKILNII